MTKKKSSIVSVWMAVQGPDLPVGELFAREKDARAFAAEQGFEVKEMTIDPPGHADGEASSPVPYDRRDMARFESYSQRLWTLLSPPKSGRPLDGVPLDSRAAVALELIEELSNDYAIDGDLVSDEDYLADEKRAHELARLEMNLHGNDPVVILKRRIAAALKDFDAIVEQRETAASMLVARFPKEGT